MVNFQRRLLGGLGWAIAGACLPDFGFAASDKVAGGGVMLGKNWQSGMHPQGYLVSEKLDGVGWSRAAFSQWQADCCSSVVFGRVSPNADGRRTLGWPATVRPVVRHSAKNSANRTGMARGALHGV